MGIIDVAALRLTGQQRWQLDFGQIDVTSLLQTARALHQLCRQIDHVSRQVAVLLAIPIVARPNLSRIFQMGFEKRQQHALQKPDVVDQL